MIHPEVFTIFNNSSHYKKSQFQMTLTLSGNPNILSKISFCDKECSNINDNKTKAQIVEMLDNKYKIQIINKDFIILNPNVLRNVTFHQHILSTFTNGNPYLLYLTKIDGVNSAIYIDKKLKTGYTYPKMHCVKYRFDDSLFEQETIFAGELIRDNERRWFFLIDNIILYKGMNTSDKNIIARFDLIHTILKNEYKPDHYLEICPLQIKRLFLYKNIRELCENFIPTLSYTCKGLIFHTLNNRHNNYAYIMPRESQIPVKTTAEIDLIVEEKFPELWEKKHNICNVVDDSSSNSGEDSNNLTFNAKPTNNTEIVNVGSSNVVFRILKTEIPDIYNLYFVNNASQLVKHSNALVPNIKLSHYLYETFRQNPEQLAMNVECRYSTVFDKWCPIRFVGNSPYSQSEIENVEKIVKKDI